MATGDPILQLKISLVGRPSRQSGGACSFPPRCA